MKIVGLCGLIGSGKSTVAQHLVEEFGFVEYTMAGPLKHACAALFGLSEHQLNDKNAKEEMDPFWHCSPRLIMQRLGTDIIREHLGTTIPHLQLEEKGGLFTRLFHKWASEQPLGTRVVVSDIRFYDEAQAVVDLGGSVWRVDRVQLGEQPDSHSSEAFCQTDSALFSGSIVNDGLSLEALKNQVDVIFESLQG